MIVAEALVAQNIFFAIIALTMVVAALRVVTTANVVHAALYLVVVLAGVAALFVLTLSEFTAVTQVLVYIGAVIVLFLFGIMLTRAQIGSEAGLNNRGWGWAVPVAVVLLGLLSWAVVDYVGDDKLVAAGPTETEAISDNVLSTYLVPFLAISFILLAAAIGAIVLARKD